MALGKAVCTDLQQGPASAALTSSCRSAAMLLMTCRRGGPKAVEAMLENQRMVGHDGDLEGRLLGAAVPWLVLPALIRLRLLDELLEGLAVLRCSTGAGCCAARPPSGVMLGGDVGPEHLCKATMKLTGRPPTSLPQSAKDVSQYLAGQPARSKGARWDLL